MNNQSIKVVDLLDVNAQLTEMDFSKCFICQEFKPQKTKNKLDEALIRSTLQGCSSMSRDFESFIELQSGSVPTHIELSFQNRDQFSEFLTRNNCVYHKQCRDLFNAQKLKRLQKRCIKTDAGDTESNATFVDDNEKKVPFTAKQLQTGKFQFDEAFRLAFADIVQVVETSRTSTEQEFYKLSQLAKTMSERLSRLGFKDVTIHTSRLKDQLLGAISGLRADRIGREILFSFEENVKVLVSNANKNDTNNNDEILEKAAQLLRESFVGDNEFVFSGSLNKKFISENTVSKLLVKFISQLLGDDASNSKISENIAQLIQFNSVKYRRKPETSSHVRHNIKREQPLPIYIALLVHER